MGQLKRDNKNEVGVPIFLDCCCGLNLVDRKASPPGFVRPQIGGPFSQSHSSTVFYLALFALSFTVVTIGHWYFSSLGVTNKTFQLARSIFSFHVEMFFLLGEPKASLVIKRSKHEN